VPEPPVRRASPDEAGRSAKARYVWERFEHALRGRSILDVGADRCHLRKYVDADASYWGIGRGGSPDELVDLEREPIPFDDRSFEAVLCLDVLEHLENPHEVLDDVCRVSSETVIVSLPNPWGDLYAALRRGDYREDMPVKYYGLPADAPEDRHKWFFSAGEARAFVAAGAERNGMAVVDETSMGRPPKPWKHPITSLAEWALFRRSSRRRDLYTGTLWFVLTRRGARRVRLAPSSRALPSADNS
jgi:hypothetical protein